MMESFFKSLENLDDNKDKSKDKVVGIRYCTFDYSAESFLDKLLNTILSDVKIQDIIRYGNYLDYDNLNNTKTRTVFQQLWTNERFLRNLLYLLRNDEKFLYKARTIHIYSINHIIYDYYSDNINAKNSIVDLLLEIAEIVDFNYILPLTTIMDKSAARMISIANFSSPVKGVCHTRFNNFITKLGYDFSVNNIIYIYSKFYSKRFSDLFISIMTDEQDYDTLPPIEKKIYDNITLATLHILDSMSDNNIRATIKAYGSYLMLLDFKGRVRFSLNGLSSDWVRITNIVEEIKNNGINIP